MTEIKYPKQKTYFICYDNSVVTSYGSINPSQCMITKSKDVITYVKEDEYIEALSEKGITLEEI